MLLEESGEVAILGQDDSPCLASRREDGAIGRVSQTQLGDCDGLDPECVAKPAAQSRRQLRVNPDDHAAMTG